MKFLESIIRDQQAALKAASAAIDELKAEIARLKAEAASTPEAKRAVECRAKPEEIEAALADTASNEAIEAQKNIKARMILAGVKQIEIARRLRVSRSFISEVVAGKKATPRIRLAIARALGASIEDLWPESPNRRAA